MYLVPFSVFNTGQTAKGFFVVKISENKMRLAYQTKKPVKVEAAGKTEEQGKVEVPLEWEWKYPLQKTFTRSKQPATGH